MPYLSATKKNVHVQTFLMVSSHAFLFRSGMILIVVLCNALEHDMVYFCPSIDSYESSPLADASANIVTHVIPFLFSVLFLISILQRKRNGTQSHEVSDGSKPEKKNTRKSVLHLGTLN